LYKRDAETFKIAIQSATKLKLRAGTLARRKSRLYEIFIRLPVCSASKTYVVMAFTTIPKARRRSARGSRCKTSMLDIVMLALGAGSSWRDRLRYAANGCEVTHDLRYSLAGLVSLGCCSI